MTFVQSLLNSDLVPINDAAENPAIADKIANPVLWADTGSPTGGYLGPCIGLQQAPPSLNPAANWLWVDGSSAVLPAHVNWSAAAGQPDGPGDENVGIFYKGYFGGSLMPGSTWGNVPDDLGSPSLATSFVVEGPLAPPVPGPLPVVGALAAFRCSCRLHRACRLGK